MKIILKTIFIALLLSTSACGASEKSTEIVHDTEYYILEAQNGEKWAADDKTVDAKLAAFRKKIGVSRQIFFTFWLMILVLGI